MLDDSPTQAEVKEFETRELDAPFNKVYAAATEALFDLGYTMTHSDKETGVLVGEKRQRKDGAWLSAAVVDHPREEDLYDKIQLTILVRKKGSKSTKLRIKSSVNKETRFNRDAINEVWVYVQREVMMHGAPKKSKSASLGS